MAFEFSRFHGLMASPPLREKESKWLPLGSGASYVTSPDFKNSHEVSKCLFLPQPDFSGDFSFDDDAAASESIEEIASSIAEFCMREDDPRVVSRPVLSKDLDSSFYTRVGNIHQEAQGPKPNELVRSDSANSSNLCNSPSGKSSFGSGDISPRGSPTSVLGEAGSKAWDLLFAAAERIQKLATKEAASDTKVLSKDIEELLAVCKQKLQMEASTQSDSVALSTDSPKKLQPRVLNFGNPPSQEAATISDQFQRQQVISQQQNFWTQRQQQYNQAWLQYQSQLVHAMQHAAPMQTPHGFQQMGYLSDNGFYGHGVNNVFNQVPPPPPPQAQSPVKIKPAGTGVFLPKNASGAPAVASPSSSSSSPSSTHHSSHSQSSSPSRKPARSTTVIIPPRLVRSLGLQVDSDNNVLLRKSRSSPVSSGSRSTQLAVKVGTADTTEPKPQHLRRNGGSPPRKMEKAFCPLSSAPFPEEWSY